LASATRAYAKEKLDASGERDRIARRRAAYYRNLSERAEGEATVRPTADCLADYAREIDNLRDALDWAFSPGGDRSIGVALTAAAVPLWTHLSLIEECRDRVERAVAAPGGEAGRDARCEMRLQAALGASLRYTKGAIPEVSMAWTRALEIAESLEDVEYQLRALWGLWFFHSASSRHRVALELAQRLNILAAQLSDSNDRTIGERAIGVSQHYLGEQPRARLHIDRALADYVITADDRPHLIRFQIDQLVMTRVFLARILWLQGFPDQAMRAAEASIEDARAGNHAMSLCYALFLGACPIALAVGDLVAAEHYVGMLLEHSSRLAMAFWGAWGRSYQGALFIKRGEVTSGLRLLRAGFNELTQARSAVLRLLELLMAEALGQTGQIVEGLAAIDEAIEHSKHTEEVWLMAELLRVRGELLLSQEATGAAAAEQHFRQSLDWARRQGALFWELRAATSLAQLLHGEGRSVEARALLRPVYDRFTEGYDTADLIVAKRLLDELGCAECE
jgi:predicted ATPase